MVTGAGVNEQVNRVSSRVLDVLEFIKDFGGHTTENAVVVVKSGRDEGKDPHFSSGKGEGQPSVKGAVVRGGFS